MHDEAPALERPGRSAPPPHGIVAEPGPPEWNRAQGAWIVSRHADVAAVLRHPGIAVADVSAGVGQIGARAGRSYESLVTLTGGLLFFRNPPFHDRARLFLKRAFAMMADRLTPEAVDRVVAPVVAEAAAQGRVEAMAQIANRIPTLVMARALGMSDGAAATVQASAQSILAATERGLPLRVLAALDEQSKEFVDLMRREIEAACRSGDSPLAGMAALGRSEFGFSESELVGLTFFLLWAGIETTSAFLGSAILFLLLDPEVGRRVAQAPHLTGAYLDEVLRLAAPARRMPTRLPPAPIHVGGVDIEAGTRIVAHLERAHYDPLVYERPAELVIGRRGPPSFAFGTGGRACLGAALARLEATLLLRRLFAFDITLCAAAPDWEDNPRVRRLETLDLLMQAKERPSHT